MPRSHDNRGLVAQPPRSTSRQIAVLALAAAVSAVDASPRPSRPTPAVHEDSAPRVVGIYPSGQRLPANLLRMYIVFSASMSTGESRTRVRLVDGAGRTIDRAFLALDEELWDPSGRRLTVLFDPGRIKRGLRANLEMGPPLVEGRRYSLVVDAGWRDAHGRPLAEQHVKTFAAIAPRRASPDPGRWSIVPPEGRTRTPLVVHFDEPLDRALLFTSVAVLDERGDPVHGIIEVGAGEGEWSFTPGQPWQPGRYRLRVSPELEDAAGNSLERVFDAELSSGSAAAPNAAPVPTREFLVTGKRLPTALVPSTCPSTR